MGPNGGRLLAKAFARWPSLRALLLTFNTIGNEGLEHLFEGEWDLENLCLDHNGFLGPSAAAALCRGSSRWPNLKILRLSGNGLDSESLDIIMQVTWPKLEVFTLSNNNLGPGGLAVVAAADERLPCLKKLTMDELRPGGFPELLNVPWLNLEVLFVSGLHWSPGLQGVRALADATEHGRLPSLKELRLPFCFLDATKIEALLRYPWPKLEKLDLLQSPFGNRGAMSIGGAAERLPSLVKLKIEECGLGAKGMAYLFNANRESLKKVTLSPLKGASGFPALPKKAKCQWELENRWDLKRIVTARNEFWVVLNVLIRAIYALEFVHLFAVIRLIMLKLDNA